MNTIHSAEKQIYGEEQRREDFRKDLQAILNRYSQERTGGNTPDFILADYLIECLRAIGTAIEAREKWCGRSFEILTGTVPPDPASGD